MPKNTFLEWSTTANSNTDVGGVNIAEGCPPSSINDAIRTVMAQLRADLDGGTVFATKSGGYTAVANDNNAFHRYSAAATIALTAAATLGADWHYSALADGGDLIIDPNASELINGATTLRVPDGSYVYIVCTGSAFYASVVSSTVYGACRLTLSGGNLLLSRFNGRRLTINGVGEIVPSAGVTLAPSGLTPATLYYIYAYMSSGTMTLESSTTAYVTDAATGIRIKTGDATRTLVGTVYPETGPVFTDTTKKRFVRSWYNDPGVALINNFTANRTRASITPAELDPEIRCEFLIWAGELAAAVAAGSVTNNTANGGNTSVISFDGATAEITGVISISTATGNVSPFSAQALKTGLAEGYHYATLMGYISAAGTGTWYGDADGRRTSLSVNIHR